MTTTILLAPAAGGKTQRLVELLIGEAVSIQPRWAVLPDRTQVTALRRRIAAMGGALGVSVGTFGDLFQEILARAGRPVAVTPEPARQRLLRLGLRQLEADGSLPFYQPILRTPGFHEVIGEAIAEMKRARVEPQTVAELARSLDRGHALAEMARIFTDFETRLAGIPWTDREGLNRLAIEALRDQPGLLADMPLIAVDGFDSFEAAQLEALAALAGQVGRLIIALPGSPAMERAAYRRFAKALARLRQVLPEAAIEELPPPETLPEPFIQLEASLFERGPGRLDSHESIEMIEARSPADEAREALRWLKARLVRDQVGPEDCAVIAPDAERYGPLLRRAAAEFGVRLRFTHGEPLVKAPSVSALLELLELSRSNWLRRLTLQAIRSPYFDLTPWGLKPGDGLALDAASHAGQVVGGLDQWEEALTRLRQAEPNPTLETLEEMLPTFSAPTGEAAARLLRAIQALANRLTPVAQRSTAGWVEWLEDLLDELGFPERTAAEHQNGFDVRSDREHPAFERLRETLRALVLGEIVTGEQPVSYGEFLDELRSAVEAASFHQQPPSGSPAINVLGLLEARGGRYRAVVVMGLSEGLLPAVEREDPFLDEPTRAALSLESRLGREQPGLFYQAVTRADAHLLLTRPYLADDGEAWEASPFWRVVERMLSGSPHRLRPEDPRPLEEAGSPQELLFWGVRRGGMPASLLEPHLERWAELQHSRDVLAARNTLEPEGPYEGGLAALTEGLSEQFNADHLWSPSRLETYGTCPHMFFTSYLLDLQDRQPPEPGLDPAQLGSILHESLEAAYRAALDPTDADSVLQALDQVIDPILDGAPERHGFRPTPLWAIERAQHTESLRETIRALAEQGAGWTPIGLELAFGIDQAPPLDLEFDGRVVRVRGIVDRLDRRPDGGLRVIDYKTGRSRLNVAELNEGRRIQLPLYALAAQEALGLGQVVEGIYWAILAAEVGTLRLSNYRAPEDADPGNSSPRAGSVGPGAAYATARRHVRRIVDGVRAGQFPPIPPPGGCPDYCPAAAWCWRYQPSAT
ncbi:MAG: PD-(D/E)XK nuclease family protein [Anaerolineales bacterium]